MNKRFMRFPEGKKKALTLSYDDCMEEDIDLIHRLQKRERPIRRGKPIVWLRKRKPKKCMNIRL